MAALDTNVLVRWLTNDDVKLRIPVIVTADSGGS